MLPRCVPSGQKEHCWSRGIQLQVRPTDRWGPNPRQLYFSISREAFQAASTDPSHLTATTMTRTGSRLLALRQLARPPNPTPASAVFSFNGLPWGKKTFAPRAGKKKPLATVPGDSISLQMMKYRYLGLGSTCAGRDFFPFKVQVWGRGDITGGN